MNIYLIFSVFLEGCGMKYNSRRLYLEPKASSRLLTENSPNEYPWIVEIVNTITGEIYIGSILSTRYILTLGSFTDKYVFHLLLG